MISEKYLFGPVPSRRFGRSLGVDLIPYKTCTLDCVFCQLGRTTNKTVMRKEYVSTDDVITELKAWLKKDSRADYITLSGSGEPTLHEQFGEIINFIHRSTSIPSVLLTNGTLLHIPEVRDSAAHADVVKVSLSAWDQASYECVNRPHIQLKFDPLLEGQKSFRRQFQGELWLEVIVVQGMNSALFSMKRIAALAKTLQPDRIHLNTVVRPPAEKFAKAISYKQMSSLCGLFEPTAEVAVEFKQGKENGLVLNANKEMILSMLQRRPCTTDEIAKGFGMHLNEVSKYLGHLMQTGQIRAQHKKDNVFYTVAKIQNMGERQ